MEPRSSSGPQTRSVFVSFASADHDTARAAVEALERSGIRTFFAPRDVTGGQNFAVEIVKAVAACDLVLVLLSSSSIESPHVRREVTLAIDERRILLPVAMPGTTYPNGFSTEWTYWLSAVQVVDFKSIEKLVDEVRKFLVSSDEHDASSRGVSTATTGPRRPVVARRKLVARGSGPSAMLRPDRALTTFTGRDADLARLEQWCLRDDDFDCRIVVAGAGQGKTRLAYELIRILEGHGWASRVLGTNDSGTDAVLALGEQPTLVVVDYAETRVRQLAEIFEALLEHGLHDRVRILLLARSATDWWRSLAARNENLSDLLSDVTIQPLDSIANDRETVDDVYVAACTCFAEELGVAAPAVAAAPLRAFDSVLEILETALGQILTGSGDHAQGNARLLAHERRYLAASAASDGIAELDEADLYRISAAFSLLGAESEDSATALIGAIDRDLSPLVRRQVARLFRRLYPGSSAYVAGLRPDALAEDLVAESLANDGHLPGLSTRLDAAALSTAQLRRAYTVLGRGAARYPALAAALDAMIRQADDSNISLALEVAVQIEHPEVLTAAIGAAVETENIDARALLAQIPDETVALADLAAQLSRRVVSDLPEPDQMELSDVTQAMDCSNRFSDAGWTTEAAAAAQLSVDRLDLDVSASRAGPDLMEPLGRALTNLSNRLWELGRLNDSVEPARRAVTCLAGAQASPAARAAASNNLAFRLAETGDVDGAVAAAMEAERLAGITNNAGEPADAKTLGSAMNNLACLFLEAGHARKALLYATDCVRLRRSQALGNRDRYLPYVARALANAAPVSQANGDPLLADRCIIEARALHELTGERAPIFRFEQAESATIHAILWLVRGEWAAAEKVAGEGRALLALVNADLGELSLRLEATLDAVVGLAGSRHSLDLDDARVRIPQLLEYRDL